MTLWDFYRTLPYPLPIKDELDEMKRGSQYPWLSLLVNRFVNTEACAKQQLDLSLATIFTHSEPRKKTSTDGKKHSHNGLISEQEQHDRYGYQSNGHSDDDSTPRFEAEAYDKDSEVIHDNNNHDIVIPDGDPADAISKNMNVNPTSKPAAMPSKANIITEADNPAASL